AVLCPLLAYLLVGVVGLCFFHFDSDSTQQAVVDLIVGASGLLALVAAPFKGRFGYRENEKRAALKKTESGSGSWNQVDLDRKSGRFSALVSLAFADASLLFRSSASVLFELAILFAAGALAFKADYLGADIGAAGLDIWATVFVLYYSCFASGLFSDSKRKDSIVRERLSVKPGAYWLADAFAAFLVWTALLAALFFVDDYEEFHLYGALEHYLVMGTILFLFYGVSLWSASLKGSRIVVWAVLFATALSLILCWEKCFTHIELSVYDDHDETVAKQTLMLAFVVETLVFIVASRGVATARIRNRKARWSVAFPIVLTVATVAFALCPKLPKLPEESRLREIDAASCPQSQEEYDRLVADAVKSVESVVSSPLFNTIEGTDSVAVELNDLRERFVDACELTKKRAASFVDVENAERAFYSALRKALDDTTRPAPEPNEPNGLLDFLCEIPSLRPTAEQQTDNNYAFALYGNLASGVKTPEAGAIIAKARAKNDKVWKRALWNAVQFMPDRLDYQLKKLQGEFVFQRRFPSSSFSDRKSLDYNAILNALDPSMQLARNEVDRRLLYLRLAAKTPRPDGSVKPWESLSAIYLRGLIPEPPQGPLEPFVQPLIAQPPRFDLDKSADPSRLVAVLDESGRGLTIPKLSERFVQNKARVVRKETSDQQSAVEPGSEHKAYYVADAPLRIAASAPKYAPDMTNDGIVSLEISGVYPLFESGGSPLLDDDNHRYYGVIYSDVDEYGEPIVFAPEPTVEKPGFDCGDAKLLTSRENGPSDEPQISRVRAFLPFQAD
ncbi:MAG: hypothetical protein IKX88_14410, partial [Thermoguttaceae bacterium]|nr:hypothetical protein [Thermoguttaceae bacterium]